MDWAGQAASIQNTEPSAKHQSKVDTLCSVQVDGLAVLVTLVADACATITFTPGLLGQVVGIPNLLATTLQWRLTFPDLRQLWQRHVRLLLVRCIGLRMLLSISQLEFMYQRAGTDCNNVAIR